MVLVQLSILRLKNNISKVNLCSGLQNIPGYLKVDFEKNADLVLNLNKGKLPFKSNSLDVVICISAINYFTKQRGQEIVKEVYRVLKKNGTTRFATQDLEKIAKLYIDKDLDFFFKKLPNGKDRFEGKTMSDKFNSWFYGYQSGGNFCQYFYDFETLEGLFKEAGFCKIDRKNYLESSIEHIDLIDNREDQMFFLEAKK